MRSPTLARAIHEGELTEELRADVERLAADPRLDEYNRMQATEVLVYLQALAVDRDPAAAAEIEADLDTLELSPMSRRMVASLTAVRPR